MCEAESGAVLHRSCIKLNDISGTSLLHLMFATAVTDQTERTYSDCKKE